MKKNVFIVLTFVMATLAVAAQTSGAGGNATGGDDRIAQL